MNEAMLLCIFCSGLFFLVGLVTGVWKYFEIIKSPERQAHMYVDICHRAALMYSFSALVVLKFVELSPFSPTITFWSAALPLAFFAFAISTYFIHGLLKDTENQFRAPHMLGSFKLPGFMFHGAMWALIIAELGGFSLLFMGFIKKYML